MDDHTARACARLQADAAAALVSAIGMHTENQVRISRGEAIAYPEAAFQDLLSIHDLNVNSIITRSQP